MKSNYERLIETLFENNSNKFSLTKLGMIIFLFPSITFVFLYDAIINKRMDWMNTSVFICGIVTPRLISQLVAARLGGNVNSGNNSLQNYSSNRQTSRLGRRYSNNEDQTDETGNRIARNEPPITAGVDIDNLPDLSDKNR